MTIRFIPLTGRTNQVSYLAYNLSRASVSDYPRRDVFCDHTSGTDYGVLTNDYPGKYATIDANLSTPFDMGTLHTLHGIRATRVNIIG